MCWSQNHNLFFLNKYLAVFKESFGDPPERYSCEVDLAGIDIAIESTLLDELKKGRVDSIHEARTDEEGNFRFEDLKPGEYAIIGRGQAGANDIYWRLSEVKVGPAENAVLKLSQVQKACLATD